MLVNTRKEYYSDLCELLSIERRFLKVFDYFVKNGPTGLYVDGLPLDANLFAESGRTASDTSVNGCFTK